VFRGRENLRGVLEARTGEPRVNHARIFDVVVGENPTDNEKHGEDDAQDGQADGRGKKSLLKADTQNLAPEG
jgi:hypothetical protein